MEFNDSVIAVYPNYASAVEGITKLHESGFSADEYSIVGVKSEDSPDLENAANYGDRTETDAMVGAGAGGAVGILAGATVLTLTGIGPVIAAGALAAGITGAIVGGLLGAFQGWGIHEDHLKNYEEMVKDGKSLVVVRSSAAQVAIAYGMLNTTAAEAVHMHAETSADSPEIDDRPLQKSRR
ncbi:hypothetical protein ETAA8_48300 [Anatilimnocola aggregata]|uniref:General stress protein 17M-like domain-containing protein n=1 Tax=Anatilimnocola aggregata TaxID=2528021 RepID=A0A517YHN7_9BACT|nr:DUF1269 domain-containing protein [Anatilimnocola aggregata]QDU29715.1 hypothetical protein ETAA8_48300 [Anatilimnocola aggregata]